MDFARLMGIEVEVTADGLCVLALELGSKHMSRARRAHGGVLFTLLDTAMGRAVLSELPEGRGCATVEAKLNYFRPVQSGRLRVEGRVVNRTRNTAYAEGTIWNDAGALVARSSGTFMLTDTLEQADRERL